MAQMTMITGAITLNGMRKMAAHQGTVVSTTIRPTMLPRYMLAIRPQTKSGLVANSIGPGVSPQIISPPIITAAVAEDGTVIPSRDRTLSADELGAVTVSRPGLYALCTGDIASPSATVLINATGSGPADAVVQL